MLKLRTHARPCDCDRVFLNFDKGFLYKNLSDVCDVRENM